VPRRPCKSLKKQTQTGRSARAAHFSDLEWADFARGFANAPEIRNHLDAECPACRQMAGALAHVEQTGAADRVLNIPAAVLARAQEIFQPAQTGWMEALRTVVVELVSHVPLDLRPAGVRSLGSVEGSLGDRFLYRAGNYAVDLKVEPPMLADSGEIIGQILNDSDAHDNLDGVVVQMVAPGKTILGKIIGETSTNRFGEFLIEYPALTQATLRFALKRQGERIDLPLRLRLK
jgi:hypothetical protein